MGIVQEMPLNKSARFENDFSEDLLLKNIIQETGSKFPSQNIIGSGKLYNNYKHHSPQQ